MLSKILWLAGSAIFFILGALHLYFIFFTQKLHPRDKNLIDAMKNTSPQLTNQTTTWKAWLGFNAGHSAGVIFIGATNIILDAKDFSVIENSFLFSFCTILAATFYLWLAKKYWFSTPFVAILIAVCCFLGSMAASFF